MNWRSIVMMVICSSPASVFAEQNNDQDGRARKLLSIGAKLIETVKAEMTSAGGRFEWHEYGTMDCGSKRFCNGYFTYSGGAPELHIAGGRGREEVWIPVLCHEYGHFKQWRENSVHLQRLSVVHFGIYNPLGRWLGHQPIAQLALERKFQVTAAVEADAERLALNCLDELQFFDSPQDRSRFIASANAYVFFYAWVRGSRAFYEKGQEPFLNQHLVARMPEDAILMPGENTWSSKAVSFIKTYADEFDPERLGEKSLWREECFSKVEIGRELHPQFPVPQSWFESGRDEGALRMIMIVRSCLL